MATVENTVEDHYTHGGLWERISDYLASVGADSESLSSEDLYPIDQLHGRGIAATAEHAEFAGIKPGMYVLDIGSGVGGSSRYLSANCGCQVLGIDLTQEFVDVARELTARCGLADSIEFQQANALELPMADDTFDHAFSHNVTMNIAGKEGLAREVTRVLKPGGRFSCSELNLGPAGDLIYPVPWAKDESSSFLVTPDGMEAALEAGGLRVIDRMDITEANLAYIRDLKERAERGEPPLQLNHIVMGDDFVERVRNSGRCAMEGRIVENLVLAEKK